MNDKEYRDTRKKIERLVDKWRRVLWLTQWRIDVTYFRDPPPEMNPGGGRCSHMDIEPHWEYLTAAIRVNMPQVVLVDAEDLERTVMHELLHCIVCEMREVASHPVDSQEARNHEERVVSHLTKAVYAAEVAGWNSGKADLRKKQKAEEAAKAVAPASKGAKE